VQLGVKLIEGEPRETRGHEAVYTNGCGRATGCLGGERRVILAVMNPKSGVSAALRRSAQAWFVARARRFAKLHANPAATLVVFDLDNTLADTAPSFARRDVSDARRLGELLPKPDMVALLAEVTQRWPVLVASARANRHYPLTLRWLRQHTVVQNAAAVVLVPSPQAKVDCIAAMQPYFGGVLLIDDLSHGHEHGEVKLYDGAMQSLDDLGVSYLSRTFIESNASFEDKLDEVKRRCLS
jgi:hypothetical protein